jgi:hypothetical protein
MEPFVLVRTTNALLLRTFLDNGQWASWTDVTNGVTTNNAPAVTWNAADGKVWAAVLESGTGKVKETRLTTTTQTSWVAAGVDDVQLPEPLGAAGTAPMLAVDGADVHVFVGQQGPPRAAYQAIYDGDDSAGNGAVWGRWRRISTRARSTMQPAVAVIAGQANVITQGATNNILEQALE